MLQALTYAKGCFVALIPRDAFLNALSKPSSHHASSLRSTNHHKCSSHMNKNHKRHKNITGPYPQYTHCYSQTQHPLQPVSSPLHPHHAYHVVA